MNYSRLLRLLCAVILVAGFSSGAFAQATRTWVSGVGDDVNPCSRTAPCKTFAGAISKTAAGGEISVLDPGGFGGVTITKGMTLNGTGTLASILAVGQNGVFVNAGASDVVIVRDISINGANSTVGNGIRFIAGGTLMVDHCWIYGLKGTGTNGRGIAVEKSSDGHLKVVDTVIENLGEAGISINTTGGLIKATIDRTRVMNCVNGIHAKNLSRVVARDSVFSHNTTNGVFADATSGAAHIRVWTSQISLNGVNGVRAGGVGGGTSLVELAQNQIDNNSSSGVFIFTGGVVETFSNNSIRGNNVDGCPSCTAVGPGN